LPDMRKREESEYPVAVFDIGGTWFRSAVLMPDGKLLHLRKFPAINYLYFPADRPQVLQSRLVDFLLQEVARFSHVLESPLRSAAISLGAALNARTGLVLNSGPLWGPDCGEFDLLAALRRHDSNTSWQLWNDITANLLYHSTAPGFEQHAKLALITVSTGIGMRTFERSGPTVPVDRDHGVQGEIGHLPVNFLLCGKRLELNCDCGGKNHLNAFCSGRGIGRVLEYAAGVLETPGAQWMDELRLACSEEERKKVFTAAVGRGETSAVQVLRCFTRPLAEVLTWLFTIDPAIDRVIFTGGVVESLGESYMESLLNNALDLGLYQVTNRDPAYFCRRVVMAATEDRTALIGAGSFISMES